MSNRTRNSRLAALEQRIAEQDQELARMRDEIARARDREFPSMRRTAQCPGCGGRRLLHVTQPTELSHAGPTPVAMQHTVSFWGTPRSYGPIEHFVCRACFLVESYVVDLDGLEPDGTKIRAIDPPPEAQASGGPFR